MQMSLDRSSTGVNAARCRLSVREVLLVLSFTCSWSCWRLIILCSSTIFFTRNELHLNAGRCVTDVLCGQAERSKILAIRTSSSVARQPSHNEQRQHRLAAVVRMRDRWATGMKAAMTRQCNIKSEDGDYSDLLDDDEAYTSGPELHPVWYSLKSVVNVCVCVRACVQLCMMNCAF